MCCVWVSKLLNLQTQTGDLGSLLYRLRRDRIKVDRRRNQKKHRRGDRQKSRFNNHSIPDVRQAQGRRECTDLARAWVCSVRPRPTRQWGHHNPQRRLWAAVPGLQAEPWPALAAGAGGQACLQKPSAPLSVSPLCPHKSALCVVPWMSCYLRTPLSLCCAHMTALNEEQGGPVLHPHPKHIQSLPQTSVNSYDLGVLEVPGWGVHSESGVHSGIRNPCYHRCSVVWRVLMPTCLFLPHTDFAQPDPLLHKCTHTCTHTGTHTCTFTPSSAQKANWKLYHSSKSAWSHSWPPSSLLSPLASRSPHAGRLLPAWSTHTPHTQVAPFWPPPALTCPLQSAEQPCPLQPLLPDTFQNLLVNTSRS